MNMVPNRAYLGVAVVTGAALIIGLLLTLVVLQNSAEAAFPGKNGKIAFSSHLSTGTGVDNPTGDSEIFTINPDDSELTQLTFNDEHDFFPAWTSDGTKIASL